LVKELPISTQREDVWLMDNLDFRFCYERGLKFYRAGKLFEAKSYLRRAFLIWPWDANLKRLLEEIDKEISGRSKQKGVENYARDTTRNGFEI